MKKNLLLLFLLAGTSFIFLTLNAQENSEVGQRMHYKHGLGVAAGATTGYGLSYRYCPSRFTVQTTFAPYKSQYSSSLSLGFAFLYNLVETERTSFFIYQGNHFLYNHNENNYSIPANPSTDKHWNNGIGIGIEFISYKRVSINLMAGYASYRGFQEINVTGETGLYYKF
jgi:hypothetical protein